MQTGLPVTISVQGLIDLSTTHTVGDPNTGCSNSYNAILAPAIPEMTYASWNEKQRAGGDSVT